MSTPLYRLRIRAFELKTSTYRTVYSLNSSGSVIVHMGGNSRKLLKPGEFILEVWKVTNYNGRETALKVI